MGERIESYMIFMGELAEKVDVVLLSHLDSCHNVVVELPLCIPDIFF